MPFHPEVVLCCSLLPAPSSTAKLALPVGRLLQRPTEPAPPSAWPQAWQGPGQTPGPAGRASEHSSCAGQGRGPRPAFSEMSSVGSAFEL